MRYGLSVLMVFCAALVHAQFEKAEMKVRAALADGKPYKAITLSERALTKKGAPPIFHVLRADGFIRVGRYQQARYHLEQAREALGGTPEFRSQLIGVHLGQGQSDSAFLLVQEPEVVVNDAEQLFRCGTLFQRKGDAQRALRYFDLGVRTYPDMVRMLRERASCHAQLGDTVQARADFDRAIALAPRDAANYNSRGYHLHMRNGDYARAMADMNKAIKQDPNYGFAFSNRGWCAYKMGDVEKARKDLALAIRKNPGNAYAFRSLGIIDVGSGDQVAGCVHFHKALELGFTDHHGPEVAELVGRYCASASPVVAPVPVVPVQEPPANAPGGTVPKSNAP
ncbi:MAG: tetratricopeptide repeat protein [Flavobacteriales bacterium]|nr:tetratricopeptide repeat protein [Flavobacteriales bacterium]